MKTKLFLSLGLVLLTMSCNSEKELPNENVTKISKIYVGTKKDAQTNTRTVTNATTNAVTWTEGDEIAIFRVGGTGRNDYKRFILESGAGDVSAYFKGVGPDDYLTPGGTYKVIYPYASVVNYYDRNNGCYVAELSQPSSDASHLSDYDWLFSVSKTIPNDNTMPSFLLQHAFSLIKINLTVSNYTGALRYLQSMSISSNGHNFAESVYWNDNLDFTIAENSEKIGISYSSSTKLVDGKYTFIIPIYQVSNTAEITFTANWAKTWNSIFPNAASYSYITSSTLTSGKVYELDFTLSFETGASDVGLLTMN